MNFATYNTTATLRVITCIVSKVITCIISHYIKTRTCVIFQVQLDGNDTVSSMTNGYPTHNRQNGKDIFHLRFRKFASEVLYDPFIGSNLGGGFGGGIGGLY